MTYRRPLVQVSYAFASAFDEAAAGSGKGAKRPLAEEGGEPEGASKPSPAGKGKGKGKGKGGLLEKKSPVSLAKAVKNGAELAGMREAHLRDAEAICDFLAWIEKEVRHSSFVRRSTPESFRGPPSSWYLAARLPDRMPRMYSTGLLSVLAGRRSNHFGGGDRQAADGAASCEARLCGVQLPDHCRCVTSANRSILGFTAVYSMESAAAHMIALNAGRT